jgi:hypothetical protein
MRLASLITSCATNFGKVQDSRWLPTLDTLRNLFYTPTIELKMTFELLRQDRYATY